MNINRVRSQISGNNGTTWSQQLKAILLYSCTNGNFEASRQNHQPMNFIPLQNLVIIQKEQECIPVAMRTVRYSGCLGRGCLSRRFVCLGGVCLGGCTPPPRGQISWHTLVKTLLLLRTVSIFVLFCYLLQIEYFIWPFCIQPQVGVTNHSFTTAKERSK